MKNGFYWARFRARTDDRTEVVFVDNERVYLAGSGDHHYIERFTQLFDFISTEPLTPPENT